MREAWNSLNANRHYYIIGPSRHMDWRSRLLLSFPVNSGCNANMHRMKLSTIYSGQIRQQCISCLCGYHYRGAGSQQTSCVPDPAPRARPTISTTIRKLVRATSARAQRKMAQWVLKLLITVLQQENITEPHINDHVPGNNSDEAKT